MTDKEKLDNLGAYFLFIMKLGYQIQLNLTNLAQENKDQIKTIKLFCSNKKNSEILYYFYEVTESSIYSLDSFLEHMKTPKKQEEFIKGVHMRMIPFNKNEVLIGLLSNGYNIDDVYKNGNLVLNKTQINELFYWANFKGGTKAIRRG